MTPYTDEELVALMQKAPQPIQDAISDPGTALTILALGKKANLHIDTIGTIAELNTSMLLGLISPLEFLDELIRLQIPEAQAKQIMIEINQKIFMPIQQKMRGPQVANPISPPPKPPPPPSPKVSLPTPEHTLSDHEEAHIEIGAPPPNLPGASSTTPPSLQAPPLPKPVQRPLPPPPPPPPPKITSYTADPYRESFE